MSNAYSSSPVRTAEQIAQSLAIEITAERVLKAKGAALRAKVSWDAVLAALSEADRATVDAL